MSNPEWQGRSIRELEALLERKIDEVYRLRQEIDRRKGNGPESVSIDFEQYVKDE